MIDRVMFAFICAALFSSGCFAQARRAFVNPDGSKEVFDPSTGWTETDTHGKTTNMSAVDLTSTCDDLPTAIKFHMKETESLRIVCDVWADLQPRTQIEQVSFSSLVSRLVEISPPQTDFARYRGEELKSQAQQTLYDATIIPDDVGGHASCTVLQAPFPKGALYKYACFIKTSSYSDAIALERTLVQRLDSLQLTEDQIKEHGLVLEDEGNNECAPTGECAHSHIFVSALKDGKIVDIEAVPDFVRNNTLADLQMFVATGRHNPPDHVKPDSGSVEFAVYSHGVLQNQQ
jgi:hypothetical protein